MNIQVLYFAAVREIAGVASETFTFEGPLTAAELLDAIGERYPRIGAVSGHIRIARNDDFVDNDAVLTDGDTVALIPPVSGGSGAFRITTDPLIVSDVRACVERPEAGAIVVFEGVVRNHTGDNTVSYLEYEAYTSMALAKLKEVAGDVANGEDARIAVHHRFGRLEIGDVAVVIAVSTPHRTNAFRLCADVIDRLKQEVPIWKKEVGPDGQEWVGFGP